MVESTETDVSSLRVKRVGIDNRIERLREKMTSIEMEIMDLLNQRNLIAPISCLPVEILGDIFSLVAHTTESTLGWNWHIITHICRSWRKTALEIPGLWTLIDGISNLGKVEKYLERSQAQLLTVAYERPRYREGFSIYDPLELILVKDSWRIRELIVVEYETSVNWASIFKLLKAPLPNLDVLHLRVKSQDHGPSRSPFATYFPDWLLADNAPKKELVIDGFHIHWPQASAVMRSESLRTLYIDITRETRPAGQISIAQILKMLQGFPELRNLTLINVGPTRPPNLSSQETTSEVSLRYLEQLILKRLQFGLCGVLFRNIKLPEGLSWTIECRDYPFHNPVPFVPELLLHATDCKCLEIILQDWMLSFKIGKDDVLRIPAMKLSLKCSRHNHEDSEVFWSRIFSVISTLLGLQNWKTTSFDVNMTGLTLQYNLTPLVFSALLSQLKKAQVLRIRLPSNVRAESGLISALTKENSAGMGGYLCPDLKDLVLENGYFREGTRKQFKIGFTSRCEALEPLQVLKFVHCIGLNGHHLSMLNESKVAESVLIIDTTGVNGNSCLS